MFPDPCIIGNCFCARIIMYLFQNNLKLSLIPFYVNNIIISHGVVKFKSTIVNTFVIIITIH